MIFSSKKYIVATLILGSLFSISHNNYATTNTRLAGAIIVSGGTYYLAGHHKITDEKDKSHFTKVLDLASKTIRMPIKFYNENKDALHLALSAGLAVYYGPAAINSFGQTIGVWQFKGNPSVSSFVSIPKPK